MSLLPGTRLGSYEILAPIGAGGMGEVFRARDTKLDRDVAIKVLPESVAGHPETLARFEREPKAVAALSHPNILSIFDFGTHDGTAYAVMELLEGETLRGKIDAGPIPQRQAVDFALQIARGLSAAHEKGVVHRDLKPENLFVTRDAHLKILDFGLAKRTGPENDNETSSPTASKHTEPGTLTDVFQVQSDIASRVAQSLGVALGTGEEKRLLEKPTQNLAAYDAFLMGREVEGKGNNTDPATLRKALGFFDQAVALDPGFAQAWVAVSGASTSMYANGKPTPALAERARQAAEKAIALTPDRADGYIRLGGYHRLVRNDIPRALEQYEKARRLAPTDSALLFSIALTEQALGGWKASIEHLIQAERLDPRSVATKRALGFCLLRLRRHLEAREALDRALALAPANLDTIEYKAMTFLAQGDLTGARAVLNAVPKEVEPTALVAEVANYYDLVWVLDEGQRDLLLRLTPSAFDDDKGQWGASLAQAYALKKDVSSVRTYAEQARKAFEEDVRLAPQDADRHASLGFASALVGRKEDAVREGERAVALDPVAKDAYGGAWVQHTLVRIYILVGEPEKALDQLEPLLKMPYYLTPGWLEIDPNFDPLRTNPRFQKLVAGTK